MKMQNPYSALSDKSFWKKAVVEKNPESIRDIYSKKFDICESDKIATAGSCFAQHVSRSLKLNGFSVLDEESSDYSANYGNIYTVSQLLQLAKESIGGEPISDIGWEKEDYFVDALRPGAVNVKFSSREEVQKNRSQHLQAVRSVMKQMDIFVFTLGLTEAWVRTKDNVTLPTAPGVVAGTFDPELYYFKNFDFNSIVSDFKKFKKIVEDFRDGIPFKTILTVSPVPLTATASNLHVLVANTYSKSSLRAVAACLSENKLIDYFPSYEIVTNPNYHLKSYESNLRTVKKSTVQNVMKYFFSEHYLENQPSELWVDNFDLQCEEQILEMYSEISSIESKKVDNINDFYTEVIGDSHLNSFTKAIRSVNGETYTQQFCIVDRRVLRNGINPIEAIHAEDIRIHDEEATSMSKKFLKFSNNAKEQVKKFEHSQRKRLIIVGGLMGDNFLRYHGTFSESVSPVIPIISNKDQIADLYKEKLTRVCTKSKKLIKNAIASLGEENVRWVVSPMPTESCARIRFGDNYLNSNSQKIYNIFFNELLFDVLGKFIDKKIIIIQPPTTITESGFSCDKYAFKKDSNDVHLNESFYKLLLKRQELMEFY